MSSKKVFIGGLIIDVDTSKKKYIDGYIKGYRAKIIDLEPYFLREQKLITAEDFNHFGTFELSTVSPSEALGNLLLKITKNEKLINRLV